MKGERGRYNIYFIFVIVCDICRGAEKYPENPQKVLKDSPCNTLTQSFYSSLNDFSQLVLWPAEVTAGPVDAIMAFFGLTPMAGILVPRPVKNQAPLVSIGEMERSSTQNWNEWMDFDPQFRAFRGMISIDGEEVDISKESADGDTVVCPQHEELAAALVKLEVKRKLVRKIC